MSGTGGGMKPLTRSLRQGAILGIKSLGARRPIHVVAVLPNRRLAFVRPWGSRFEPRRPAFGRNEICACSIRPPAAPTPKWWTHGGRIGKNEETRFRGPCNNVLNFLRNLERAMRFELTTPTLARLCSTTELCPRSLGPPGRPEIRRAAYRRTPFSLQGRGRSPAVNRGNAKGRPQDADCADTNRRAIARSIRPAARRMIPPRRHPWCVGV
jgi:hypothetical protein